MRKQTLTAIIVLAVTALGLALTLSSHYFLVRAGPPSQVTETPPMPQPPQSNRSDSRTRHLEAAIEPAATAVVPPGTAYFVLPPAAFTSDGFDPDGYVMDFVGGYFEGREGTIGCLLAPVHLPQGVSVVSLEAFVEDSNTTLGEGFDLYRIQLASDVAQSMAYVHTSQLIGPGRGPIVDTSIDYAEVSSDYAYQITTCPQDSIFVYGVRVGYVATTYLPTVMREQGP